ncbi:MAG: Crp/Fnr family transcriptional regulator [Pseudomonadota bacterium]|nr:Crp/Fnr family transcriptional regulator [Pseudomonadota bacterium]
MLGNMQPLDGSLIRDAATRKLVRNFSRLSPGDRETVIAFVEFLLQRSEEGPSDDAGDTPAAVPLDIPRPAVESVVKAIKRLSATYPMVEKSEMLNETSSLMTQHLVQGRRASEVIDDLEAMFSAHFEVWKEKRG